MEETELEAIADRSLPAGASLLKGVTVSLNAGITHIPSPKPYIGFYRHPKSKTPLSLKIAL